MYVACDVGKDGHSGSPVDWGLLASVTPCLIGLIAWPSHLPGIAAPTRWIHRIICQLYLDAFYSCFFLPGVMTVASAPSFSVSALMCLSSMSSFQGPCQLTSLPLVCFCRVSSSSTIRARAQLLFSEFQALGHVRLTHPITVFSKLPLVLPLPFSQSPLTFLFWPPLSLLPLYSFSPAWFFFFNLLSFYSLLLPRLISLLLSPCCSSNLICLSLLPTSLKDNKTSCCSVSRRYRVPQTPCPVSWEYVNKPILQPSRQAL